MTQEKQSEKIFYKYSPIKDSLIKNIRDHQIYFNNPANFNDIADCKLNFYLEATKERWIEKLIEFNNFRREQLEQHARELNFSTIDELLSAYIDKEIGKRFKSNGDLIYSNYDESWQSAIPLVSCFCEERDNPVMWGLYANYHKGVCLGYRSKLINGEYKIKLDSKKEAFCKVRYERQPPSSVNLLDDEDNKNVSNFVRTKFKKWEYENEYRIILTEDKQKRERTHCKTDLECIIFGAKVEYCDAYKVYDVIKKNYAKYGTHINFCKVNEIKGQYDLKIEPIDIENYIRSLRPE